VENFLAGVGVLPRTHAGFPLPDAINQQPTPVRACSACPGDYEDPERTAWTPGPPEEEFAEDEFPVSTPVDRGSAIEKEGGDEFPAK
jgi:hypothetical protein